MNAYLIEIQTPTGWKRTNIVYGSVGEAERMAQGIMSDPSVRQVRILRATVELNVPVREVERDQ